MAETAQRYTAVAIVLHWAIAFAIIFMIPLGFWMHGRAEDGDVSDGVFRAFQLHKSVGLTILVLSLARLGWRLANPPPPLPAHMPAWEKVAALATHWAFYVIIIAMPLSGWLYVSAGWSIHDEQALVVTTHYFGLFRVPALFGLPQADVGVREAVAEGAFTAHWVMAYTAIGLAALHVAAALKHHFFDRDETLAHMVPGLRAPFEKGPPPKNPVRLAILGGGLGLASIAAAVLLYAATTFGGSSAAPPQAQSSFEVAETPAAAAAPEAPVSADPAPDAPQGAPAWRVDSRSSSIGFAFVYSDEESGETRFEGRFTRWRADIRFDPNNLEASSANVTIDVASATDGVAIHDNSLPTEPWFDAANHPTATFRTSDIRRSGDGYEARGELTIKGRARNVELPFTLTIDGNRARMNGRIAIDRRAFDIGERTEADELISRDVDITIRVDATRAS